MKDVIMAIVLISIAISLRAILLAKIEKTTGKRGWKVEPELVDRFLDVLANNDYRWLSIPGVHEIKNWDDGDAVLFIEILPKKITYERYSSYPTKLYKRLNVTEVTEEWLGDKENKIITQRAQL